MKEKKNKKEIVEHKREREKERVREKKKDERKHSVAFGV